MGKRVDVTLVCDECGKSNGVTATSFGYDGKQHKVDLCPQCKARVTRFFDGLITASMRGEQDQRVTVKPAGARKAKPAKKATAKPARKKATATAAKSKPTAASATSKSARASGTAGSAGKVEQRKANAVKKKMRGKSTSTTRTVQATSAKASAAKGVPQAVFKPPMAQIRAWAVGQGMDVPARGPLPDKIVAEFSAAAK